jgi:hypothetical protein
MDIFRLSDFKDKKILIIGNKPIQHLSEEKIMFINSFDVIVRVNGMNNLNETGGRIDWWWLNVWNWKVLKKNIGNKDYSSTKILLIDKYSEWLTSKKDVFNNLPKLNKNILKFNTKWASSDYFQKNNIWNPNKEECTIPTTDVACISYLTSKFNNTKLYLTCLDIEEREKLFKSHSNWKGTWHENVGKLECNYLKELIKNKKIEYVEL